jgi:hypothetical protein
VISAVLDNKNEGFSDASHDEKQRNQSKSDLSANSPMYIGVPRRMRDFPTLNMIKKQRNQSKSDLSANSPMYIGVPQRWHQMPDKE